MRILIVGDWVVDEYWLTSEHRSPTASRIGRKHLRAKAFVNSQIRTLAGAGRATNIIYSHLKMNQKRIVAVGAWREEDKAFLTKLAVTDEPEPSGLECWQPSQLACPVDLQAQKQAAKLGKTISLVNIGPPTCLTTRVYRVLLQKGDSFESLGRIDWESQPSETSKPHHAFPDSELLQHFVRTVADEHFDAVVIKDLGKGVVTDNIVSQLVKTFREANQRPEWFVSTKTYNPNWLTFLKSQKVALVIIPEVAATDYASRTRKPNWFCGSREKHRMYPTDGALQALNGVHGTLGASEDMPIICLPRKFQLLARLDDFGVHQAEEEPRNVRFYEHAPMASAFFPKAVCRLLRMPSRFNNLPAGIDKKEHFREFVKGCLDDTAAFNQHEAAWINGQTIDDLKKGEGKSGDSQTGEVRVGFPADCLVPFTLSEEDERWKARMLPPKKRFKLGDKNALELWRAMTEVERYVCIVDERRYLLARLVQAVREFETLPDRQSTSGLLIAHPGTGKTSLVRGIAAMCDVRPLEFNITQMLRRDEVFSCFDSIVTAQAQERHKPVFVFFDEINAQLERQHVYDAFLAPLEDGYYFRNGRKFFIHPCIWLFAATPDSTADKAIDAASTKRKDFESRLTLGELNLSAEPKDKAAYPKQHSDQARYQRVMKAENVYRAAAILQQMFPDVRRVSVGFLQFVYDLPYNKVARELRELVRTLRNVRYGEVSGEKNLPEFPDRLKQFDDTWVDIV